MDNIQNIKRVIIILVVAFAVSFHLYKVNDLNEQIISLQEELYKAKEAIAKQNSSIEQAKVSDSSKENIKSFNKELDKVTKVTINKVTETLKEDNSDTTQLLMIDNILKEFSNE